MADVNDGGVNNNAGGNNDGARPAWMDSLPDAHKNNPAFMAFKEPAAAWDRFDAFLKAEGNTVVIPGDSATDEERKTFYAKLGVPETADGYEFDKTDIDATADKMFREVMLNSRIPKREAKGIHTAFVDMLTKGKEAQAKAARDKEVAEQKALDDSVNTLKDIWKGDAFKVNTELAKRAYKAVAQWAGLPDADAAKFIEVSIHAPAGGAT